VDDWNVEVLDEDYAVGSRVGSASVNRTPFGPCFAWFSWPGVVRIGV
jgi:hypothetical protein